MVSCNDSITPTETITIKEDGKTYIVPKKGRVEIIYRDETQHCMNFYIVKVDDSLEYLVVSGGGGTMTTTKIE